ncbi:MAG: PKD domain-containing protein, partial [Shewanella sp.]
MGIPLKLLTLIACTSLLAACGGDDGNADDGAVMPPITPPSTTLSRCTTSISPLIITNTSSIRFQTESTYIAGQSSVIIANLLNHDSQNVTFRWQQIDGPTLQLVSQNSPVLAFDTPTAGGYRFSVHVTGSHVDVSEEIAINVDPASTEILNIRQDHQVVEGNNVSLRLGQHSGLTAAN